MTVAALPNIADERIIRLTKREIEVLSLVSEGRSSQEAADEIYVSKRTIDFHLSNIYEKLQVKNRLQAFRRAIRLGITLLDLEEIRAAS